MGRLAGGLSTAFFFAESETVTRFVCREAGRIEFDGLGRIR